MVSQTNPGVRQVNGWYQIVEFFSLSVSPLKHANHHNENLNEQVQDPQSHLHVAFRGLSYQSISLTTAG